MAEYKDYDDDLKTVKEGYMYKRGAINKDWRKRNFVLNRRQLSYFRGGRSAPSGSIDMKSVTGVHEIEFDNSFKVETQKRVYCLKGETHDESQEWRLAIINIYEGSFQAGKT